MVTDHIAMAAPINLRTLVQNLSLVGAVLFALLEPHRGQRQIGQFAQGHPREIGMRKRVTLPGKPLGFAVFTLA
jgi:hypothetical protein